MLLFVYPLKVKYEQFLVLICRSFVLQHTMCHLYKSEVQCLFTGVSLVTNIGLLQDWTGVNLTPTPTPPNIELLRYISCYLPRFIYFPLKYKLKTSFVRIKRHFRYRQLLKHVTFHDRRARRGLRLRDETMASRCCGSKNKALKNISIHFCYLL